MTALDAAKQRLEDYVRQLATHPMERVDLLRLKAMEDEIARAAIWVDGHTAKPF